MKSFDPMTCILKLKHFKLFKKPCTLLSRDTVGGAMVVSSADHQKTITSMKDPIIVKLNDVNATILIAIP